MVYIRCDRRDQQCDRTNIDVGYAYDDGSMDRKYTDVGYYDDSMDREYIDVGFFIANRNVYRSYDFIVGDDFGIFDV